VRVSAGQLADAGALRSGIGARRALPLNSTRNFRAETFTLTAATPTALEADGELIGHLPAVFSLERLRLRVMVP